MASALEFVPWSTFSGSSTSTLSQSQREWLDVSDYADGIYWIEVKDISGTGLQLDLQTSSTEDDADFSNFLGPVTTVSSTMLVTRFATATTPMMRYVRWRLSGASASWAITFRVYATLKNT